MENQKLKSKLETAQKALVDLENKLNRFMKGKEALDLTMITSNKEKRRLGFQGESSHDSK